MTGTTKINFDLIRLSKDQAKTHNCFKLHVEIITHTSKGSVQRKIYLPSIEQIPLNHINLHKHKNFCLFLVINHAAILAKMGCCAISFIKL